MRRLTPTAERTMTRPGHSSPLRRGAGGLTAQTAIRERGRRFRHHHAAAHTDRGENHAPTGTLITAQALNGGREPCLAGAPVTAVQRQADRGSPRRVCAYGACGEANEPR